MRQFYRICVIVFNRSYAHMHFNQKRERERKTVLYRIYEIIVEGYMEWEIESHRPINHANLATKNCVQ